MISLILLFHLFVLLKSINICKNCKYFIPDDSFSSQIFYAKCAALPKIENVDLKYLVSGPTENDQHMQDHIDDYYYCSTSRNFESLCGKEGKKYKKKYQRKN